METGLNEIKKIKTPKIIWRYQYIKGCDIVTPDDEIELTPDKMGRWQIKGYIKVKTSFWKQYKCFGRYIHVIVCAINQKKFRNASAPSVDYDFACLVPTFMNADMGFGDSYIYGKTANECMIKAQAEFDKTFTILMGAII